MSQKPRSLANAWMPIVLLSIVLGGLAFFYTRLGAPTWALPVGQTIPTFALVNVLKPSEIITDKALLGQPAVLHVWASWCSNCATEVPILQQIRQRDQKNRWFGVNFKDNLLNAQQWLETHGDSLGIHLYDPNGVLSYVLGVIGTPETFVLNCQGKVVYRHAGPLSLELYDSTLQPVLEGLTACAS